MDSLCNAVPLAEASRRWLPPSKTGKPIHVSVLGRWATVGVLSAGRRVRLVTTKIGAVRYVLESDLREFLAAINAEPEVNPDPIESPVLHSPKPSRVNAAKIALADVLG